MGEPRCEFHHVHIYVDKLKKLEEYKRIESDLNTLASKGRFDPFSGGMRFLDPIGALPERIAQGRRIWENLTGIASAGGSAMPSGQDFVEQLIVGLGWRVTAEYKGNRTYSVLVSSMDSLGVKFVISCISDEVSTANTASEFYSHFEASRIDNFFQAHNRRQGIAVLGFEVFDHHIDSILTRYKRYHPNMLVSGVINEYKDIRTRNDGNANLSLQLLTGSIRILEVYAYYLESGEVDVGTVLRFVERCGSYGRQPGFGNPQGVLPGLKTVPYTFDGTSIPAYSDHWVSNVYHRERFLKVLEDTLGFTPKVDFNAGVVAAGEAKIESTVTGNQGNPAPISDSTEILRDQSQVYLPINNALSKVGHVHGFLQELGQGVQHLANRVEDLVAFIERVNNYREICGGGFSFLRIPRSYFGYLDTDSLLPVLNNSKEKATRVITLLQEAKLVSITGIVKLDIERDEVVDTLQQRVEESNLQQVADVVLRARYSNIYKLLKDHVCEKTYLQIVRNQILVDIQGNDILYQIFTSNILQRSTEEEAPFLEFIQRVCSERYDENGNPKPIKPGCGGFGIRNFLTLFLSIEVSKAMNDLEGAIKVNDKVRSAYAAKRIKLYTEQLDVSNPVLTEISDAMTAEADALESLSNLKAQRQGSVNKADENYSQTMEDLERQVKFQAQKRIEGNLKLQEISSLYASKFAELAEHFK